MSFCLLLTSAAAIYGFLSYSRVRYLLCNQQNRLPILFLLDLHLPLALEVSFLRSMSTVPSCPTLGQYFNARNLFLAMKWCFPFALFSSKESLLPANDSCHCSQEARDFVSPLIKANLSGPSRNRVAGNQEATAVVLGLLLILSPSQSQMEAQIRLMGPLEESWIAGQYY